MIRFILNALLLSHFCESFHQRVGLGVQTSLTPLGGYSLPTTTIFSLNDDTAFAEDNLIERVVPIGDGWNISIFELKDASDFIDGSWEADDDEDPFGFVAWPGSVVAAQELRKHKHLVKGKDVLILGAGVGIEAQAAAELGAKTVVCTDINPVTLRLLEKGANRKPNMQTLLFDISDYDKPLPEPFDLMVVADVLYDEDLVKHVAKRCREAAPRPVLLTDSQNFVRFPKLPDMTTVTDELESFTGSGVVIPEDQTYDVDVTVYWIRN